MRKSMQTATLTIDGKKFRVVPAADYAAMHAAWQREQREAAQDAADAAEAVRRLKDRKERPIAWEQAKKRLGLP